VTATLADWGGLVVDPAKRPARPPPQDPKSPESLRIVRLIAFASEWQFLVDRGQVRTRAEIAVRT